MMKRPNWYSQLQLQKFERGRSVPELIFLVVLASDLLTHTTSSRGKRLYIIFSRQEQTPGSFIFHCMRLYLIDNKMNTSPFIIPLLMAIFATETLSFSPSYCSSVQIPSPLKKYSSSKFLPSPALFVVSGDENDDFPPDESMEYSGSVDWDAEWKKVVEKDGKLDDGAERPGKDFYKSEAEIAAIKAANTATKKVTEAGSSVANSLPDIRSLSGDWRFWIAILALVSIGLSLLTAPSEITSGLSDDAFYV